MFICVFLCSPSVGYVKYIYIYIMNSFCEILIYFILLRVRQWLFEDLYCIFQLWNSKQVYFKRRMSGFVSIMKQYYGKKGSGGKDYLRSTGWYQYLCLPSVMQSKLFDHVFYSCRYSSTLAFWFWGQIWPRCGLYNSFILCIALLFTVFYLVYSYSQWLTSSYSVELGFQPHIDPRHGWRYRVI